MADTSQSEQAILVAEHADNVVAEQADSAVADQANNGHQMSEAQSTQLLLNMLDEMSPIAGNAASESKAPPLKTVFRLSGNYVPSWMQDHDAEPAPEAPSEEVAVLTDTQLLEKLLEENESGAASSVPEPPNNNINHRDNPPRGVVLSYMVSRKSVASASQQALLDILHDRIVRPATVAVHFVT